jgi:glycosyltransferase involved in cell wall biosynthesis
MKLAIIIPALNEEANIANVVRSIPHGFAAQIIVVDNGSTDQTTTRAREAGAEVVTEPKRGYGQACLTGLAQLRDDIEAVAFLDADGSDDPSALPQLLEPIERDEMDFVVSARSLGDARKRLTPQQRFGNALACGLICFCWGHRFRDLGPMRVIRREALERLKMSDRTWGWTVEMQIKAVQHELRIREIPVVYHARASGKSKISGTLLGAARAGAKILSTIGGLWIQGAVRPVPRMGRGARAVATESPSA